MLPQAVPEWLIFTVILCTVAEATSVFGVYDTTTYFFRSQKGNHPHGSPVPSHAG